jgi:hypothetical protein
MERLRVADSLGQTEEVFLLRTRLRDGDFEIGDRIDVRYEGTGIANASDSLVVRAGKVVTLQYPMGDLNLSGLLQAEAVDSIKARAAIYFKSVIVQATPRLRVSVTGGVRNAGPMYVRSDTPLSEVVMRAGTSEASDLSNILIKRGTQTLWQKEDTRSAMIDGMTLEALGLEPGDEVVVGMKVPGGRGSMAWLQVTLSLVAIAIPLIFGRK